MVGANDAVFARIRPVVDTWAGKVVHIGGVGDGHRMKLLNNFLSLGYAAIYAEALTISKKVGIPIEVFDSVIRGGRMDCGFYQTFMGYALEGNREAHRFTIRNAYKDLKYLESMANDATVQTPADQRREEQLRARDGDRGRRAGGLRAASGRLRRQGRRNVIDGALTPPSSVEDGGGASRERRSFRLSLARRTNDRAAFPVSRVLRPGFNARPGALVGDDGLEPPTFSV